MRGHVAEPVEAGGFVGGVRWEGGSLKTLLSDGILPNADNLTLSMIEQLSCVPLLCHFAKSEYLVYIFSRNFIRDTSKYRPGDNSKKSM